MVSISSLGSAFGSLAAGGKFFVQIFTTCCSLCCSLCCSHAVLMVVISSQLGDFSQTAVGGGGGGD